MEKDSSVKDKKSVGAEVSLYHGIFIFTGLFTFFGLILLIPLIISVPIGYRISSIFGIILIIFPYLVSILIIIKDRNKMK